MLSSNSTTTARELRSIQSFIAMDHPYMVKTYGVWSLPGYIVVDMELAEATLLDLMLLYNTEFGEHLDPKVLGLYMWQVAEALDFLNARKHLRDGRRVGFQHGDIKPNNILLLNDTAKLTDYGLSIPTHGPSTPCIRAGTMDYAAPEVFQGYFSDYSDQFSFAVTYCVLRFGGFPFPKLSGQDKNGMFRPAPDLALLPPGERPVLARALSQAPQDRYPGCREMMLAVLKAQGLKVSRDADGQPRIATDEESSCDSQLTAFTRNLLGSPKTPPVVEKSASVVKSPSIFKPAPSKVESPPSAFNRPSAFQKRPPTGT